MIVYIETIILHTRMIVSVQYYTVLYSTVQYCTVLYSTVQYCTVQDLLFVIKKIKNVTRTRGARRGGAKRAPRVRVTFLIFLFLTHFGSCFGMNGHPRGATDVILSLS